MEFRDVEQFADYITEIEKDIDIVIQKSEHIITENICKEIIDEIIYQALKNVADEKSTDSLNIDLMSMNEIYRKLTCKCDEKSDASSLQESEKITPVTQKTTPSTAESKESTVCKNVLSDSSIYFNKYADVAEFKSVVSFANFYIDGILKDANDRFIFSREDELHIADESMFLDSYTSFSSYYDEMCIKNFTVPGGKKIINDFLRTWTISENWSYCINFIAENYDTCSDLYLYEAIWSLPTEKYPIPQVTASVYFNIDVSRVKPPRCPIKITYVFEGNSYVHKITDNFNQEYFLMSILTSKEKFFKSLHF